MLIGAARFARADRGDRARDHRAYWRSRSKSSAMRCASAPASALRDRLRVGAELGALLRCADMALYQAKAEGRGAWRLFETRNGGAARDRRELEFDLRRALENDAPRTAFPAHLQYRRKENSSAAKRYCAGTIRHEARCHRPCSFRWPKRLDSSTSSTNGCARACLAAATWPKTVSVAVNLSAVHFRDLAVIDLIKGALSAAALSPHRLEIEITETAVAAEFSS